MRHGNNYAQHLEEELKIAREEAERKREASLIAEGKFRRLLPPDETTLELSVQSLLRTDVVSKREAFRSAHISFCEALTHQAEIEEELFVYPEDYH